MSEGSKIKLSRLRDIGWDIWDPIGIRKQDETWEGHPAADEYDGYMLGALRMLREGSTPDETVDYLVMVATNDRYMGMTYYPHHLEGAVATVNALKAYASELGPL